MEPKTAKFFFVPLTERKRSYPSFRGFILILFSSLGFSFSSFGQQPAVNLDQGANGPVNSRTTPITWQNGDLNANAAHYVEGHSVPYRLIMTNLPHSGTDTVTLTMNFDITQSNAYALDFITGDSNLTPHTFLNHTTPEAVDPLSTGVSGVPNTPSYLRVSIPDYLANNPGVPGATNALNHFKTICDYSGNTPINANNERNSISLFGGTFVQSFGVQYGYDAANVLNLAAGNQTISFTVKFVPSQATVVMAWGGHISRFVDWGGNKTAALINGSPYHMRTQSWGPNLGNIGNQDRALQASTALIPPACPGELMPAISLCTNAQGAPISCPTTACAGGTLYYKVPQASQATTFVWFVSPSTGVTITPLTADPNDSNVSITFANAGSYQINVALSNSSGFADTCSANVTINPPPTCNITGNNSICSYDSTSFSGPAGMDSYSWTGPAGFTASTQSTGKITQQGTYTLVVTKNGCSSTCTRDLLINLGGSPPNATPGSRCGPGLVTLTAIPNGAYDSVIWFSNQQLTNRVDTGLTFTTNLAATATFYVVVKNSVGCFSLAAPATATINPVPTAPVPSTSGSGDTRCDTGVVNLHASSSDTSCTIIFWFADSARTMPLATGPDYSPSLTATTTFWVSCQNRDSCFGPSVPVTGTINPVPAKPLTTGGARCDTGVVNLHASSNSANCDSLIWYSDAARTIRVNVGNNYSPHLTATTTFYVVCKSTKGCISDSAQVKGVINGVAPAPLTTSRARCDTGVVLLSASSNSGSCDSLIWYSDQTLTTRINVGSSYSPHLMSTTTFWVVCKSVSGCVSPAASVTGTINPVPAKPAVTPAMHCGPGIATMVATPGANCDSLLWFSSADLSTRVYAGTSYAPNLSTTTSFWVVCKSINGCLSAPTMVTDTTDPVPVLQLAPVQVCQGQKVTLSGSPSGGTWASPQLGLLSGGVFDAGLLSVGVYKVGYTVTNQYGCSKTDSLMVTVTNCGPITCSYTQGYYGSTGKSCDGDTTYLSPIALMTKLLSTDMIIGIGPKTVLIPIGAAATVNAVMPGSATPVGLSYIGQCTISTVAGSCFQTNYLNNKGKINNVLLSQTITLSFNGRMRNGILLGVPIQAGYLVTQSTTGCGSGASTVPCSVNINTLKQNLMPTNVANYLTNNGANSATVADLLTLANSVLGGALVPGQTGANNLTVPSYSDINNAVNTINQAFDQCDVFIGYNVPLCPPPLRPAAATTVYSPITAGQFTVYPNPTHGTFTVESPENMTNAVITVLDLNGRVIAKQNVAATGHTVFNLDNVTSGVYVLYISDGKDTYHVKIMVL